MVRRGFQSVKKGKVLVVCAAVGRPSETWLWRQIRGLSTLQPSVACWAYENRDAYPMPGIPTHVLNYPARPMAGARRWAIRLRNSLRGNFYGTVGPERKTLSDLVRTEQPAVLLCHFGHYALRLLPVAASSRVPLVAHFHGLDVSSSLKQDRWYRWSLLRNLHKFAAIVVVGEHQRQWMLEQGVPREQVHLIPCGAPVSEHHVQGARRSDRVRFIAVSRLVAWKGVDLTIRAFAQVAASAGHVELLVVGDGPERRSLEALAASLGVGDRVVFAGSCQADQVRAYYGESDVFVQHSIAHASGWVEGFGVSIVEASAAGLPVVVSRTGGIGPQVIDGETGFLIEERNVTAMAQAMLRLAQDQNLRIRMGRLGRRHVERHFDSRIQTGKLEDVLVRVIQQDRASRVNDAFASDRS
jgi:glycosyltransferase involved in cell wall biosynthesis